MTTVGAGPKLPLGQDHATLLTTTRQPFSTAQRQLLRVTFVMLPPENCSSMPVLGRTSDIFIFFIFGQDKNGMGKKGGGEFRAMALDIIFRNGIIPLMIQRIKTFIYLFIIIFCLNTFFVPRV